LPEKKDVYGNTPLGVGLLNGHFNYGIILIEKGLNVSEPVFKEDLLLLNSMKLKKKQEEEKAVKKHKMIFGYKHDDSDESMDDESNENSDDIRHNNIFN
jgi:hypothetical protein